MTTQSIDDLVQIARNGGGLDLEAGNLSRDQLVHLAQNASEKATIILHGLNGRPTDELVHIVRNSVGRVIFVLD
jgi:hypothetical protein